MRDYADQIDSLRLCAENDDPVDECCWEDCNQHRGNRDNMCRQKIMMDAADAIEELLAAMPHRISVEERLPEPYQNVLTCAWKLFGPDRRRVYGIDYTLDNGEWACGGESYKTMVTHWMPLPKPPEEERE